MVGIREIAAAGTIDVSQCGMNLSVSAGFLEP